MFKFIKNLFKKEKLGAYFNAITQNVVADSNNSSTTNLDAGNSYTFTGTATSTLGVAGIQVSLKTDQDCNVYIDQSPDGTNWDISDQYTYLAVENNFGITVQAINSYVRVRVIAFTTTTYFRLQTALCPIVEAVPRSLTPTGRLKISTSEDDYGFDSENTPTGDQRFVEPYRLVGAVFEGTTIDSNYWTTAATGTGASVSQANAQLTLASGTNTSTVTAFTVRRGRYVGGSSMRYRAVVQQDAGTANNTRNWGIGWGATMPTVTDGAWFQFSASTFSVVVMKGTSATTISSGSFNGSLGKTYDPGTSVKTYEIYWTNSKVYFVIGNRILHTFSASTTTWANTMSFHCFFSNNNSGVASSVNTYVRVATIYRLGKGETASVWRNINTTAVTALILKRGQGRLHTITFNTIPNSAVVSVYDALTATNSILVMNPPNGATPFSVDYDLDFYTGLTITTTPNTADITIVWE